MGNLILIAVPDKNIEKIYFWEHEYDLDAEEFFDDYKISMPKEVRFRNMFCIGNNLYDCFQRMTLISAAWIESVKAVQHTTGGKAA